MVLGVERGTGSTPREYQPRRVAPSRRAAVEVGSCCHFGRGQSAKCQRANGMGFWTKADKEGQGVSAGATRTLREGGARAGISLPSPPAGKTVRRRTNNKANAKKGAG